MLTVKNLSVAYGTNKIFSKVTFQLNFGGSLAVVGPSGVGKTTLLLAIASLIDKSEGSVTLEGIPIEKGDLRVGLMLQNYGLFPWYTVYKNIDLAMKIGGYPRENRKKKIAVMLDELGLADKKDVYPANLSGGEQQRTAIARTFVTGSRLILLDEPFSALDALTREKLQDLLLSIHEFEKDKIMLLVTHSIEEAVYLCNSVYILAGEPPSFIGPIVNTSRNEVKNRKDENFFHLCATVRAALEFYSR
jgi:NitT/TauT family transport system ATP-binding protein